MSGKGSKPRPFTVDRTTFASNWDNIFGKNKFEDAKEISNYWSDDTEYEAIVLKRSGTDYFVEVYQHGTLIVTLSKGITTLPKAEEIAENVVLEKTWLKKYVEES